MPILENRQQAALEEDDGRVLRQADAVSRVDPIKAVVPAELLNQCVCFTLPVASRFPRVQRPADTRPPGSVSTRKTLDPRAGVPPFRGCVRGRGSTLWLADAGERWVIAVSWVCERRKRKPG